MTARAWPVAVAAGRRRDYSTVLTPEIISTEYGVLVESLSPGPVGGAPRVRAVTTASGGRLTVAYRTHALTGFDVGRGDPAPLRDEQGRPLLMMYGLARTGTTTSPPPPSDLDKAMGPALAAYRGFLAGEEAFRAVPSRAVPVDWSSGAEPVRRPDRRGWTAGVAALAVVAVVALIGWFLLRPGGRTAECPELTARVATAPTTCAPATAPSER
ncbi:hypothetical protein Ais01nite_71090 [Asanoa ishikariensis]|uniref:Uncharacterized protein n=1 Tax=Asanoa ishikariensis TaxID=137265 RepID=A0A1H3UPM2_9ACTN|nr:hypothetical protein [Asanoa ishikariensis]GIF69074.1 hypothetical protein Ais01nite_71090 [Asanoa ishikariensis]SDZ64011.1 hypothetical protein SAMN05421684_7644 [Asanoa ishikariensis]